MHQILLELSALSPATLTAIVAIAGASATIIAAVITAIVGRFFVTPFLSARDRQDKEAEWRKHAIELTKLDLERKLRTRLLNATEPLRPSMLDFLANYRDLQELGQKSPRELYTIILEKRITPKGTPTLPPNLVQESGKSPNTADNKEAANE